MHFQTHGFRNAHGENWDERRTHDAFIHSFLYSSHRYLKTFSTLVYYISIKSRGKYPTALVFVYGLEDDIWIRRFKEELPYVTELLSSGVPGVPWHLQILSDLLILSQPGGADAHQIILDFQAFLRSCVINVKMELA